MGGRESNCGMYHGHISDNRGSDEWVGKER